MKIHLHIVWYERKPDFSPDYEREHHGTIEGNTPQECMNKFWEYKRDHDLARYTMLEIAYIY